MLAKDSSLAKEHHHSQQSRQHALRGCISSSCLLSSTRMMLSGLGRDCAHNGFLSQLRNSQAFFSSVQFSPVTQSCLTLFNPIDCSMSGFPVYHQIPEMLKLLSIKSVMPSNHLILCCPLLLLPSIFPNIRVFSNESVLGQSIGVSALASVLLMNIQD